MNTKTFFLFLSTSVALILFLFYIDEGYYDFRWMADPGNWIVFFIYLLPMLGLQIAAFSLLFRKRTTTLALVGSTATGMILALVLLFAFFYFVQHLR